MGVTKEIAKNLIKIEAKIRGVDLKADADFVLKKEGKEGLKKVEEKLKEIGFPILYEKINMMDFYPGGLKALSLLAIQEVFNYSEKEIEEMGGAAPKISFIIRIFIKYFNPLLKFFFRETPRIWKKYWTEGEFVPLELNEKEKWALVEVRFNLHPIYCVYLKGYFSTLVRMVTGSKKVFCQEVKCYFKGENVHQYFLKWE